MNRPVDYADIDEVVVREAVAGRWTGKLRAADAAQAVRVLAGQGHSDGQIALLVRRTERSVVRIRARHEIPAALRKGQTLRARELSW